jgi:hypothetical protein
MALHVERVVKLYFGATLAYGLCTSLRRQLPPGLAATTAVASPLIWPVLLAEDSLHFYRSAGRQPVSLDLPMSDDS